MKKFIILLAIMLVAIGTASSKNRSMQVIDYDVSNYPAVKAKLFVFDENGNVARDNQTQNFSLNDNGTPLTLQYINCTETIEFSDNSIVISMDKGMSAGDSSLKFFDISKKILDSLASVIDYSISEVAVTSYDLWSYLMLDFTSNKEKVQKAIDNISPSQSSSCLSGLIEEPAGSIPIAQSANNNKSVVLLTYGIVDFNVEEIIQKAKENNIAIYIIYFGKKAHDDFKRLADETGGHLFDGINENTSISPLVNSIWHLMNNAQPCEFMWYGEYDCLEKHTIEINNLTNNDIATFSFFITDQAKPTFESSPQYLEFSSIPIGQPSTQDIVIRAINSDIVVTGTYISDPQFEIIQGNINVPKIIYKNTTHTIRVRYTPTDSAIVFTKLILESNACFGDEIYITGGFPNRPPKTKTIEIINPKCGETLVIGDTIEVRWQGLLPKDVIQLEYKLDPSSNWHALAKNTENLGFEWIVPHNETDHLLIRAIQLWPNNVGRTLDLKHNGSVSSAFFNKIGDRVVTAGDDSCLVIWNSNNGERLHTIKHIHKLNYAVFDHTGKYVFAASDDGYVYMYDTETAQMVRPFPHDKLSAVKKVEAHPSKDRIVTFTNDPKNFSKMYIWNTNGGLINQIEISGDFLLHAVFDFLGNRILATSQLGIARLYTDDGDFIKQFDTKKSGQVIGNSSHGAFNTDGSKIAVINDPDNSAFVYNIETEDLLYELSHHLGDSSRIFINFISFFYNPDDDTEYILTAASDNSVKRWLASDGSIPKGLDGKDTLHVFREHRKPINTSVFNFDGSRLLTASSDSTAKIWNLNQRDLQMDSTDCYITIGRAKIQTIPIDFGDVLMGDIAVRTQGFIRNMTDFKFNIRNIRFFGDNVDDFRVIDDLNFPDILEASELRTLSVRFQPSGPGLRRAYAEIIIPNDTIIAELIGYGVDIGLNAISNLIDFGMVEIDEYKDSTITNIITNRAADIITIDNIYLDGPDNEHFALSDSPDMPIVLIPGQSISLTMRFIPEGLGRQNGVVYFSHDGSGSPTAINMFGQGIGIIRDTLEITLTDISGKPGETIEMPIRISRQSNNGALNRLNSISANLTFNSTLLEPIGQFDSDIINGSFRTVQLTLPFENNEAPTIYNMRFKVGLGNDSLSELKLWNIEPLSHSKVTIYQNNATFSLLNICNQGGTRLFDPISGRILLQQNKPNPFSTSTLIDYELIEPGMTSLSIYDMTGTLITNVFNDYKNAGYYSVNLNGNDFPPGLYYYILQTPTQRFYRTMQVVR